MRLGLAQHRPRGGDAAASTRSPGRLRRVARGLPRPIRRDDVLGIVRELLGRYRVADFGATAAAITYRVVIAAGPLYIFAYSLVVLGSRDVGDPLGIVHHGRASSTNLGRQLLGIRGSNAPALLAISFLLTVWSAGGLARALLHGLDTALPGRQQRSLVAHHVLALVLTTVLAIGAALVLVAALSVNLLGHRRLAANLGVALGLALLVGFLALLYRLAVGGNCTFRDVVPGTLVAMVAAAVTTVGARLYWEHRTSDTLLGQLWLMIAVLIGVNIAAQAFLVGGALNDILVGGRPLNVADLAVPPPAERSPTPRDRNAGDE